MVVGLLATLYLQVRTPQPKANIVSSFPPLIKEQIVTVQAQYTSLDSKSTWAIWLEATTRQGQKWEDAANVKKLQASCM